VHDSSHVQGLHVSYKSEGNHCSRSSDWSIRYVFSCSKAFGHSDGPTLVVHNQAACLVTLYWPSIAGCPEMPLALRMKSIFDEPDTAEGETVASMVFDSVLLLVVLTCALWLVTMVLRWRRGIPVLHNSEWVLSTDLACRSPIPVEFPSTGLTTDADGMCPSHAQHADIGESGPPVPVKKVKMPCEVDIVEDNHDADMECCIVEDIRDDARPDTGLLTGLSRAPLSFKVDSDLL